MGVKIFLFAILLVSALGCTQGHCRRKVDAPEAVQPVPAVAEPVDGKPSNSDHVSVYKYDGSLQCGMGNSIALETMGKELAGIPIFSSAKKADGLMHIQVCGSATGMANVYEIPTKSLKKAESKGFKKWSFE